MVCNNTKYYVVSSRKRTLHVTTTWYAVRSTLRTGSSLAISFTQYLLQVVVCPKKHYGGTNSSSRSAENGFSIVRVATEYY